MEAPEKIYLQICGDCNDNDCKNCEFEDLEDNVTWCRGKIFEKDIEYTRTDAFIEKVVNFLEILGYAYTITDNITKSLYDNIQLIEDFKKYMEE